MRSELPHAPPAKAGTPNPGAFTLVELLVVLSIMALLATLGLPAIKGISHTNVMASASRQLLDDLALARQSAISGRTTVYVVFVPPNFFLPPAQFTQKLRLMTLGQARQMTNLVTGQYCAYALLAKRSPGDQPGRPMPYYLTEWRTLPEGVIIASNKFTMLPPQTWVTRPDPITRPFSYLDPPYINPISPFNNTAGFPFPTAKSPPFLLPYIAFNSEGLLDRAGVTPLAPDEYIPLTRASVFYARDAQGTPLLQPLDLKEVPPGNTTNSFQRIHLNWITGRARLEKQEIQ